MIQGSYVPNLVKIGPYILSTDAGPANGQTDGHLHDFIFCPMLCLALDRQLSLLFVPG